MELSILNIGHWLGARKAWQTRNVAEFARALYWERYHDPQDWDVALEALRADLVGAEVIDESTKEIPPQAIDSVFCEIARRGLGV